MKKNNNARLPRLPGPPRMPTSIPKITPIRETGLTKGSGFAKPAVHSVNFGRASRAATRTSTSSNNTFSQVVAAVSGGGVGGTIAQSLGFGSTIGSLISGIGDLFGGGKTTPAPLTAYQLPASQSQVISTGSTASIPGTYGGPSTPTAFEQQSGQVVNSVKQALLNSSSLNDIISEL